MIPYIKPRANIISSLSTFNSEKDTMYIYACILFPLWLSMTFDASHAGVKL